MKKLILITFGLVLITFTNLLSFYWGRTVTSEATTTVETTSIADMVALINAEREAENLPPLKENQKLNISATNKCKDMLARDYWSHISPDGTTPWDFINQAGYTYHHAGENLAWIQGDYEIMEKLMASPTHRDNIMSKNYKDVGIGRCGEFVVQHFGSL